MRFPDGITNALGKVFLAAGLIAGQVLTWNGANWVPDTAPSLPLPPGTAIGQHLLWNGASWDVFLFELNVKAFGAVGDGIADDTAAVQTAIDAVPQVGGRVYFPAGIYRVTQSLVINVGNRPVLLFGDGTSEQLHGAPAGGASTIVWDGAFAAPVISVSNNATQVAVRDLCIDNVGVGANAATHGIKVANSPNFALDNVLMFPAPGLGFTTAGIELSDNNLLAGAHFYNVYTRNCAAGLKVNSVVGFLASSCRFIECGIGVVLGAAGATAYQSCFVGCLFEARVGGYDVDVIRAQAIQFDGCQFDNLGHTFSVRVLSTAVLADNISFQGSRFIGATDGVNTAQYAIKTDFVSAKLYAAGCFFTGYVTAAINNANCTSITLVACHTEENVPLVDSLTSVRYLGCDQAGAILEDRLGGNTGVAIGNVGGTIRQVLTAFGDWRPNGGVAIAPGAAAIDGVIAVPGAVVGNTIAVGFWPIGADTTPAGTLFVGTVTAPGVITVSLLNMSGAPLTYNSVGRVYVDVIQHPTA